MDSQGISWNVQSAENKCSKIQKPDPGIIKKKKRIQHPKKVHGETLY